MKTETIFDYMSGKIGDVYYGESGSYDAIPLGVIDVIIAVCVISWRGSK